MTTAWRYEPETKTIRAVPENYWIATMDSWDGAVDHEANAALIASAPDLKRENAFLRSALEAIANMQEPEPAKGLELAVICVAIAKVALGAD